MLTTIVSIYIIVGVTSAISNLGKWIYNSSFLGYLFLPFMVLYFITLGDAQKKKEAKIILLFLFTVCCLFGLVTLFSFLLKRIFFS